MIGGAQNHNHEFRFLAWLDGRRSAAGLALPADTSSRAPSRSRAVELYERASSVFGEYMDIYMRVRLMWIYTMSF